MSLNIKKVLNSEPRIVVQGAHAPIIQSILDFDYLCGKSQPSINAVISTGRRNMRFFFGNSEVLLPLYPQLDQLPANIVGSTNYFLNISSGRRAMKTSLQALDTFPKLIGASIFAEGVPERHALEIYNYAQIKKVWITGPASVGLLVPGHLKLGAIGGIDHFQISNAGLNNSGNVAVFSASGGMTNEMINVVAKAGFNISFSLAFGGDRFPVVTPSEAFLAAEADTNTKAIVYFGELGGTDEYNVIELIKNKKLTKPVYAYIAGSVADLFESPPQFGHAKAMAKTSDESAKAKRLALQSAGVNSYDMFNKYLLGVSKMSVAKGKKTSSEPIDSDRSAAMFISSITSKNSKGELTISDKAVSDYANTDIGTMMAAMLLGRQPKSKEFPQLLELVTKLLADHGPHVSGAVNTMISARAGKDLVSSLTSGLLTIGPRFGGAINAAAAAWLEGVSSEVSAKDFVEQYAKNSQRIQGIGHRKYSVDNPDPRAKQLLKLVPKSGRYTKFAKSIESVTTDKSPKLILNVDGTIAAVMLDVLEQNEGLSQEELQQLADIEFFNAPFVLARSVGLTAHYLDQKRLDEGLFRLADDEVSSI